MPDPIWSFRKLQPGPRRDPFEDEFFTGNDEAGEAYDRTDFLVREAIQNALDAKRLDNLDPVRVRLAVRTGTGLPSHDAEPFMTGLAVHLASLKNDTLKPGQPVPRMDYIVYEDFGTKGLCGDPMRSSDPEPDDNEPQDFYWFWWNVGRSGKGGTDRGRWGLGKTVFPSASRINAHFGLTVRSKGEPAALLMGQAITRIHKLPGGHEYQPEGYFCFPGDEGKLDRPIDDLDWLARFQKSFGLKRGDEPGLSIVVPYCYDSIDAVDITRSVILHWFLPILRGDLIVEVSAPDGTETLLTANTIRYVAEGLTWKGNRSEKKHQPPPFDLGEWAISKRSVGIDVELKLAGISKIPEWGEELFQPGQLDLLRKRFADRERISVRVPMTVELKSGQKPETYFDVFIEQDENLTRGEDLFVRAGMTISRISTLGASRGVRGLVVVDDKELSSLLGDAEGPAHEDWKSTERRPDRRYVKWARRITFVKQSLAKIVQILTPPPAGLNEDLLGDIFNVTDTKRRGTKRKGKVKKPSGDTGNPEPKKITAKPRWWRVTQSTGGFRIKKSGDIDVPALPRRLRVLAAYDLPDGNPLHTWSKFDFVFHQQAGSAIKYAGRGVKVVAARENQFTLLVERADFALEVTGFDTVRDLYVRTVEEVVPDASVTEGEEVVEA